MEPRELSEEEEAGRILSLLTGKCGKFWSWTDVGGQEWRGGPCDLANDHDGRHRTNSWTRVTPES